MIVIGDPEAQVNGNKGELIFLNGQTKLITFYSDCISKFNVKDDAVGIYFASLEISYDNSINVSHFFLKSQCDTFEFIVSTQKGKKDSLGIFAIDYVEVECDNKVGEKNKIKIQARGIASPLIDKGFDGTYEGTLQGLMNQFSIVTGVPIDTRFDARNIKCVISSGSIYGITRLLGKNLGFVTRFEKTGTFSVKSNEYSVIEYLRKRPKKIREEDIIGPIKMQQGIKIEEE